MSLNSGECFAGFRIIRSLGAGGMGEVFLAEHPRLPRQEALKVLSADFTTSDEFRQRFLREAELAAGLWHPNLVVLHDRGEAEGRLWISMDYIDGLDAAELVRTRYPAGMPVDQVLAIVKAVASALDFVHANGMLHRDVKPANILCADPVRGVRRIALADFGIARQMNDSSGLTATNMTIGTVSYAAPEQLMGQEIDGRADQYALAATAFHLLTGAAPFQDSNPAVVISQHLNAMPPRLGDVRPELSLLDTSIGRALSKDSGRRFATCSEFAAALDNSMERSGAFGARTMYAGAPELAHGVAGPSASPGSPQPPPVSAQIPVAGKPAISPTLLLAGVLGLGLIAAVVFLGSLLGQRSQNPAPLQASTVPPQVTAISPPPVTVTVSAPASTVVRPPADQPASTTPRALPDADIHGFVDYGGAARCSGIDRAAVVMRTPLSALVVCKTSGGGAYYRGLRLRDMATIELTNIGVTDSGSTVVVTNSDDGTRYEISRSGLDIVKNGEVLGSEPAVEFATQ